jgi:hypothetical protein
VRAGSTPRRRAASKHIWSRFPGEAQIVEIDAIYACIEERGQASGAQDLCAIATGGSNGRAHTAASSIAKNGYGGVEHLHALACQKLQEIVIFAAGETMDSLLFR